MVVFFLEILSGTLAMVFIDKVKVQMTDYMKNAIQTYQENQDIQNVVDYVQKTVSELQIDYCYWYSGI